jgi:hypothetical protein
MLFSYMAIEKAREKISNGRSEGNSGNNKGQEG